MRKIALGLTILAGALFTQSVNGNGQEEKMNRCLVVYNSVLMRGGSEAEAKYLFDACMINAPVNEDFHPPQ
ncbi:hypothetical protein [Sphingobacterium sp. MYb382]|uniref:hypothetical protein n=1 Tax=Sphingobacterium sp. MYb382 TaxID=2745278 RepID=UPI0030A97B02